MSGTKRSADAFEGNAASGQVASGESEAKHLRTFKIIYLLTDWNGGVSGPSYGRFFSEFLKSREGEEYARLQKKENTVKELVSLALTWLLNQPSSVLLTASHTGQATVWTVQVEE
jgi:hypothetical protein